MALMEEKMKLINKVILSPVLLVLCGLLLVCKPEKPLKISEEGLSPKKNFFKKEPNKKSQLSQEERKIIVAKIGEKNITLGEVEDSILEKPAYVQMRYNSPERRKEFLKAMVEFEILAMEAKREGYESHPDVIQALKDEMVKIYTHDVIDNLVKISDIKDEDIKKYYEEHYSEFHRPEQKRLAHILIKNKDNAIKIAKELKSKISANKGQARIIFNEYVLKYSEDEKTKNTGGDLSYFPRIDSVSDIQTPMEVEKAKDALKNIFDISDVVSSSDGYHIVMLTGKKPEIARTLQEVKRLIQTRIFRDLKEKAKNEFVENLKKNSKVEIYYDNLNKLKEFKIDKGYSITPVNTGGIQLPPVIHPDLRGLKFTPEKAREEINQNPPSK